jgi:hypothetical protein
MRAPLRREVNIINATRVVDGRIFDAIGLPAAAW